MEYKTPLAGAQGLGSAKNGSGHWWMQRVSAVAMLLLNYWFFALMDSVLNAPYAETVEWLSDPLNSVCIVAWLSAAFYHAALGIQVVIEDYVSTEWLKIVSVWGVKLLFIFLALTAFIALLRIIG